MSERKREPDLPVWKMLLAVIATILWLLNWLAVDEDTMRDISGASSAELNFWGIKAASFALIAAVALFGTFIPARKWWVNSAPIAVGGLVAMFSAYYWLEEATKGHAGQYIIIVGGAGLFMFVSAMIGPAISLWRERRAGKSDS